MTSIPPLPPEAPAADATFVPPPAPVVAAPFEQLGLAAPVLANLARLGYHQMTPIQAASLPVALAGNDLIAQAKTGSGKTAAFGLPLLQRLDPRNFAVQAMVLCPTRELAEQVSQEIRRLARFEENIKVLTLCGGSPIRPQADSLAHGAHVVVGTPGRLMDHLSRGSLQLDALATLVLDEADRMLDMGFMPDVERILSLLTGRRQTLLFSATMPPGVRRIIERFLNEPARIEVSRPATTVEAVDAVVVPVPGGELKRRALMRLIGQQSVEKAIVFANRKRDVSSLNRFLQGVGLNARDIHGDLEQVHRQATLEAFKADQVDGRL